MWSGEGDREYLEKNIIRDECTYIRIRIDIKDNLASKHSIIPGSPGVRHLQNKETIRFSIQDFWTFTYENIFKEENSKEYQICFS